MDIIVSDRIHKRINIDSNGCWNWKGALQSKGYGSIGVEGKIYLVHRLMYQEYYDVDLKPSELVLHTCNNRKCCNPGHLYKGTLSDNMQDAVRAGTHVSGTRKLSKEQIAEIREARRQGIPRYVLARKYGVGKHTITAHASRNTL